MIVGTGIDLVELSRIRRIAEKFGHAFIRKILGPDEMADFAAKFGDDPLAPKSAEFLGARFAAKEAAVKALGTGFSDGVSMCDVQVANLPSGKPEVAFSGKAAEILSQIPSPICHLTITHTRETAAAFVIVESREKGR